MEYINNNYYHKYKIIEFILESNKEENNFFYHQKKLLIDNVIKLEGDSFFNALVIFNNNSPIGYFVSKKKIENDIMNGDFSFSNLDILNLEKEKLAHNLWLLRLILGNDKYEWKYLIEARRKFFDDENIINFKNKIRIDNIVYKLRDALIKRNKFRQSIRDWLEDKYKDEINLIKLYLEEELTSEITDETIN